MTRRTLYHRMLALLPFAALASRARPTTPPRETLIDPPPDWVPTVGEVLQDMRTGKRHRVNLVGTCINPTEGVHQFGLILSDLDDFISTHAYCREIKNREWFKNFQGRFEPTSEFRLVQTA
ncbi:MAG: hypothetical protein AB7G11_11135 [Phycisphaerales bacterium]